MYMWSATSNIQLISSSKGKNIHVAAIETMATISTFCRLSNMLCSVAAGSATCDDVSDDVVIGDNLLSEMDCYIVAGGWRNAEI